mgnify:CR=1 FL=1
MDVLRLASFSDGPTGGNPAGVVIADALPSAEEMQRIAAEVGYSETAFAAPLGERWRVRYFAPETEVPFCGHATIALASALATRVGDGAYALVLNEAEITVSGRRTGDLVAAELASPPTRSRPIEADVLAESLALFGLGAADLDPAIPPARIHAGADHLVLPLASRETLAGMAYDFETGRRLMQREGWITILLVWAESDRLFHSRNAFAAGGVVEDPATGASTAAFAGYLRDLGRASEGTIDLVQGEDMGIRCRLHAAFGPVPGSAITLSGTTRSI